MWRDGMLRWKQNALSAVASGAGGRPVRRHVRGRQSQVSKNGCHCAPRFGATIVSTRVSWRSITVTNG